MRVKFSTEWVLHFLPLSQSYCSARSHLPPSLTLSLPDTSSRYTTTELMAWRRERTTQTPEGKGHQQINGLGRTTFFPLSSIRMAFGGSTAGEFGSLDGSGATGGSDTAGTGSGSAASGTQAGDYILGNESIIGVDNIKYLHNGRGWFENGGKIFI
ncbi:hypothetical protein BDZ91DRAFT_799192 [Kalaharituber pfeilii]|nr:hypothetical protein BDZ91DRAFT_799192 [Kalaharituber pfeilii]